jgi:hypothetical protein
MSRLSAVISDATQTATMTERFMFYVFAGRNFN